MTAIANTQNAGANSAGEMTVRALPDVASELRPALFSAYRDLTALRYDFPLVLIDGETTDRAGVRSLSEIIDEGMAAISPPGRDGERQRRHILKLDTEMRRLFAEANKGRLSALWKKATAAVKSQLPKSARAGFAETSAQARKALNIDGELIACDGDFPARFVSQIWSQVHAGERAHFSAMIDELIRRLSDILKTDFTKSGEARSPWNVERAVGPTFGQVFDFEAMSRLLKEAPSHERLSVARKERIGSVIATLQSQRFFAPGEDSDGKPHRLIFESCETALRAFHDYLPEMIELIKSVAIAWLEIDNRYREGEHDAMFARLGENGIDAGDLDLFPSFLVRLNAGPTVPREQAAIFECLASNVRFKILLQTDDLFAAPAIAGGNHPAGVQILPLARMALGLGNTFVMQSSASHLNRMRDGIVAGMETGGPSLFSVYTGRKAPAGASRYLDAAAAVESRAFPVFTFDPAAGDDWAARFSLDGNPQPERDWPTHDFRYEDEGLQRQSESLAFTFADFAARQPADAAYFQAQRQADWRDDAMALSAHLASPEAHVREPAAYILMVDDDARLYRVAVAEPIVEATLRCRSEWRSLQELGGINNSHARDALATAGAAPSAHEKPDDIPVEAPLAAPAGPEIPLDPIADDEAVDHGPDPYIETARCTTCNECTAINGRMFVYNDNMQAVIADPDAGTFRQLVEAAESCQVCIIHPGQPRNSDEAGLGELVERASEFN